MKQVNLILAIVLIGMLTSNAQDYQTVKSNRVAFYTSDQGNIKCIRIDTVKFQTDSIFYPMHNIQQTDYNCFTPNGYSWIGKKVIIKNNGYNLFFNRDNDTIKIKTNAKINESWTAFDLKDSMKIIAKVKNIDILTILGQLDSVKTIGFQAYDKKMDPINPYLNEIIVSKNNGLVKMMNFNLFPIAPNQSSHQILESFKLIGLTNPNLGVQNLTWLEVYDFNAGDELHTINESSDWNPGTNTGYVTTRKTKLKYLERLDTKESILYKIEREESTFKRIEKWDNTTYLYSHDTIKAVYKPDSLFDKLPGEPIISDSQAYTHTMTFGNTISKYNDSGFIRPSPDNCWHQLMADGCLTNDEYMKGLGGPYYSCFSNLFNFTRHENSLVYYKKGLLTWGTPLILTDTKTIENHDNIKVYPNPATDFVTIENATGKTEKFVLQILDMEGRQLMMNNIELNNIYRFDLKGLKEGAYMLKLQNGDRQISKLFIKQP